MKYFPLFIFLSLLSVTAKGQVSGNSYGQVNSIIHQTASASPVIENNDQAYASVIFGNGITYGKNVTGDKDMRWRAFEIRFGKEIDFWNSNSAGRFSSSDKAFRLDLIHYNEGHPENNHRDGFGLQLVYKKSLSKNLKAEIGLGPYYSMNTTTRNGIEYNDAHLGALLATALLVDLDRWSQGMHIRLALNHVTMSDAHSSNALLVGVGKHFGYSPSRSQPGTSGKPIWLGLALLNAKTNHGGTDNALGISVDVKKYHGLWAASLSAIVEGDDEVRVDRRGVALQGWFVQPLDEKWTISAGLGPYVATDRRGSDDPVLLGLFTFQIERLIAKDWKAFASFSRVNTFREREDRDLGRVGIMRQFGS